MAGSVSQDKGPHILAVTYVMLVLATIAIALRFCARYIAHNSTVWWDDWASLAALPFVWTFCALSIYWVSIGLGKHISQVSQPYSRLALVLFVFNFVYNTGLSLIKLSVLLFYVRVFRPVQNYRVAFWIVGAMIIGWCIAINFLALFTCIPIRKAWTPTVPGHCLRTQSTFLGTAISNIVIDVIVLILPMPMIYRLHIGTIRKIGLVAVFAAGYGVIVLSILRLVSIVELGDVLEQDLSWNIADPSVLVTCEITIALFSSCLPSIFSFSKYTARKHFSGLLDKSNASTPSSGPEGSHIGPIGKTVAEWRNNGFVPLHSDKGGIEAS